MLEWLWANLPTILICIGLAGIFTAIIASMVKKRKKGQTSCGCGCKDCPMSGSCHGNSN